MSKEPGEIWTVRDGRALQVRNYTSLGEALEAAGFER